LGRASADGVEDGLNIGPRACDDAKDLAGRPLLLLPFPQFAGEPGDLYFLAGGGAATAHSLWGFRLVDSRVSQFAACSGAPSHRPPKAQDYADTD
jgi:hypothetical protein